jgi:hypothetical protein
MSDQDNQSLMFDEKLNQRFRDAAHVAFLEVPELRSVVVVYDYYRNLNDMPDISKGLWLTADGGAAKPIDSVVGSLGSLLQSSAHVLDELFQQHQQIQTQLVELSKQLLAKRREFDQLTETLNPSE